MCNWTQKEINPSSLEKKKVKPAMAMFRPDVTAAIEMHSKLGIIGFENTKPTVKFLKDIHKWISVLQNTAFRLKNLFTSVQDERLHFLEHLIPAQLQIWEEEVKRLVEAIPPKDKVRRNEEKKKFFTQEAYRAILFTSQSTIYCIYAISSEKWDSNSF